MTKQNRVPKVRYFLVRFVKALRNQLIEDERRWGNTWLDLPHAGQEGRIFNRLNEYYNDFVTNGTPIPWLKVAGNAMIGWIREECLSSTTTNAPVDVTNTIVDNVPSYVDSGDLPPVSID
jgi:hypothetical protein